MTIRFNRCARAYVPNPSNSVDAVRENRSRWFANWTWLGVGLLVASAAFMAQAVSAEDAPAAPERRQIEEVIVTAERQEASVSDTSISITAFTGDMLEDFGIRNAEDLQNLIPAAVIQPYDMAIRGVGRNFRNLGGDPGIATYQNSVYSEDFGIASSEGGLFDIERVEVLRGPQGTLYGRNAIGGAVNFINKKPTDDFEASARVIAGDNGLQEEYGMLSGPLLKGLLAARVTATRRDRDGLVDDLSGNTDPDDFGDTNNSLALLLTPTDSISWYVRGNDRHLSRRMGGADAAGIVNLDESGNTNPNVRDTTTYVFGYRAVNPATPCPNQFTRTAVVASPGVRGGVGCIVTGNPVRTFLNQTTGAVVTAQTVVPGVDAGTDASTTNHPNYAFGANPAHQKVIGFDNLTSDDLETATNGQQREQFDHNAYTSELQWQMNDKNLFKYLYGYSTFFYNRTTDVGVTDNEVFDRQFYVSQDATYKSNELQWFFDPMDDLSITSGVFYYTADITQIGDFYDSTCVPDQPCASRYANGFPYAPFGAGAFGSSEPMSLFSAKQKGEAFLAGGPAPANCVPGLFDVAASNFCFGPWVGNNLKPLAHEKIATVASDLQYQTRSNRKSYAAYTQGVYTFNPQWALTLGLRWARDTLHGEETLAFYNEDTIIPLGFSPAGGTSSLAAVNQALGFLGANGEILNPNRLLVAGMPASISLWRAEKRDDADTTWRINMDYTPTEDDLIYLSATKGSRSGGFNLVFFSANRQFKVESLISYELGYKGTLRDGTVQLNSAIYYYDYSNVETFGTGPSVFNPADTSTSVFSVPSARIIGWDTDVNWLIADSVTLGANFSYTGSEYTDHFIVNDPNDPNRPPSLFDPLNIPIDLDGKQMLQVPEMKGGVYAEYTRVLGNNGQITLLANWGWIDKVYFSAFESELDAAPEYQRTDLRATWTSATGTWSVAAFANNVFDEIGLRQVDHYSSTEDVNFHRVGSPTISRQLGLSVDYVFGQ
jgi:outer membrane receptor protein involved in Fe transport